MLHAEDEATSLTVDAGFTSSTVNRSSDNTATTNLTIGTSPNLVVNASTASPNLTVDNNNGSQNLTVSKTAAQNLTLTYILSRIVSKLLRIIGHIFAFDRGCLYLTPSLGVIRLNSGLRARA